METRAGLPGLKVVPREIQIVASPGVWTRSYMKVLVAGDLTAAMSIYTAVVLTRLSLGAYIPWMDAVLGFTLAACWPLAVAVAGGALYLKGALAGFLRFWLVRDLHERRAQTDRLLDSLGGDRATEGEPT